MERARALNPLPPELGVQAKSRQVVHHEQGHRIAAVATTQKKWLAAARCATRHLRSCSYTLPTRKPLQSSQPAGQQSCTPRSHIQYQLNTMPDCHLIRVLTYVPIAVKVARFFWPRSKWTAPQFSARLFLLAETATPDARWRPARSTNTSRAAAWKAL